jgi:hypothetical protein
MKTPRIRSVQIPDDEQGVFASLARLTDPALDGLERALRHAVPTLDRQELMRQEPLLAEVPDLDEIIGSLVSVAGTAYSGQLNVEDFVQVVVDAILGDRVIELSESEAALLTERLKRLTTIECLEIIAKGNVILRANDRNFRSASIVSEFRPVCLGEDLKVSAGIIVHQLAIRISHNGRSETAYFALDSDDVTSLIEIASRAIRKERSLREFANRSLIPILIPPPEER